MTQPQTQSDSERARARIARIAVISGLAVFALHWFLYAPYTIDDAFISFRYAENLANGDGLVFNPGERVEGYTNFLWVVLLSVFDLLGVGTIWGSKILGIASGIGAGLLTCALARRVGSGEAACGVLALLLFSTFGPIVAASADGLETPLLTVLVLAGVWLYLRETEGPRRFPWSSLVLLGAGLVRPDGCLFFCVIVLHRLMGLRKNRLCMQDLWMVLLFVVPGIVYFLLRYQYYGYAFPNTFYAKEFATGPLIDRGFLRLSIFVWRMGIGGLPLLAIGLFMLRRSTSSGSTGSVASLAVSARAVGLLWMLIVARCSFAVLSGGAWMGWEYHRFFIPIVPFIFVLGALGLVGFANLRSAEESNSPARQGYWRRTLVACLVIGAITVNGVVSLWLLLPGRYAYTEGLARAHVALGKHLRETAPTGAVLACGDAGALPYFSGLTTIDLLGLNDGHIAHIPGRFYEKLDVQYILDRDPDYAVLLSSSPTEFIPRTNISGLLYLQLAGDSQYRLETILEFDAEYYLWEFRRVD